jgi:hypothetical protein
VYDYGMTLAVIAGILVTLFGLAFATKRRYGVLGLGLAAGVLLASNARPFVSDFYEVNGLPTSPLTADTAAIITLVLLPSLLMMISGPAYSKKISAVVGALGYAVVGTILLIGPLLTALPTEPTVSVALHQIADNQKIIVSFGVIIAIIDAMWTHTTAPKRKKDKAH